MRLGRPICVGLSAILIGTSLAGGSLAVSAPAGAATTAKTSDSFVESIGVNIHSEYTDTPYYTQFETVRERLEELGVRHLRDHLKPAPAGQHEALNELAQIGVKSTLILGEPSNGLSGLDGLLSDVETELSSATEAVEGPNEWSTSGDSEWKSHLIAYQEHLYEGIKENPSLAHLPVIGPSIVHGDQEELGDISAFLDYGNIHSYPEANPPEYRMGRERHTGGTQLRLEADHGDGDRLHQRAQLDAGGTGRKQTDLRGRGGRLHAAALLRVLHPPPRADLLL